MMALGLVSSGEQCEIVENWRCGGGNEDGHGHGKADTRIEDMGLRPGSRIEMLKNDGNLLLLLVDNARIAIDRRMAMKIMVRR